MQTVVGVLRGGPSKEHDVSLRSGASIIANLAEDAFVARDIYIDQSGVWHDRGRPMEPGRIVRQIDVAILPLHGEYGETGEVQRIMERYGVPYTGPNAFGAHLAMHKVIAKSHAREVGILTPDFCYIPNANAATEQAREIIRTLHQPVVVKPVAWGSSVGVSIVGGYAPVLAAIEKLFTDGASGVFVEERIRGREATAGVVEGLRGEKLYSLPPTEIIPPQNADFFSADVKYDGSTLEICPGRFSRVENEELQRIAKVMHRTLHQRHYSRTDCIVTPRGIYFLETNSAPAVGLTTESLFPKALQAVGISLKDFLTHLVNLALSR